MEQADDNRKDKVHQTMTENDMIPKQASDVVDLGPVYERAEL